AQSGAPSVARSLRGEFRFLFFFSSRRRHTRFSRDWSSDVCSSDLTRVYPAKRERSKDFSSHALICCLMSCWNPNPTSPARVTDRSEERRVGKEWRGGWGR